MVDSPCIHHIEVGVVNGLETIAALQEKFRFRLVATRTTDLADQWVLSKNDTRFLVTSLRKNELNLVQNDAYVIDWMKDVGDKNIPRKVSVFNVCLEVCDLQAWVEKIEGEGVALFKDFQTVSDRHGVVKICTIKSCVGDVYHTLVDKKNYTGDFLPGFESVYNHDLRSTLHCFSKKDVDTPENVNENSHLLQSSQSLLDPAWTSFDHVLLAVPMGTTQKIIEWYESLFGMKRIQVNSDDHPENGLVLKTNNVGLRLRTIEYWKCAEVGLRATTEEGKSKLFFVIAEGLPPLPGVKDENQIELWMRQHLGPGIQHIAFMSPDIKSTVKHLKAHGVLFAKAPPPLYYTEVGRLNDIQKAGEDADLLRELGILIDTEADGACENDCQDDNPQQHKCQDENQQQLKQKNTKDRYLLQIFTQPVFKSDPFFMELIQREGATGFGSGNVAALYRSVQAYIAGKENCED